MFAEDIPVTMCIHTHIYIAYHSLPFSHVSNEYNIYSRFDKFLLG